MNVSHKPSHSEDETEAATIRECLRRSTELETGVVQKISHEEVMRKARQGSASLSSLCE